MTQIIQHNSRFFEPQFNFTADGETTGFFVAEGDGEIFDDSEQTNIDSYTINGASETLPYSVINGQSYTISITKTTPGQVASLNLKTRRALQKDNTINVPDLSPSYTNYSRYLFVHRVDQFIEVRDTNNSESLVTTIDASSCDGVATDYGCLLYDNINDRMIVIELSTLDGAVCTGYIPINGVNALTLQKGDNSGAGLYNTGVIYGGMSQLVDVGINYIDGIAYFRAGSADAATIDFSDISTVTILPSNALSRFYSTNKATYNSNIDGYSSASFLWYNDDVFGESLITPMATAGQGNRASAYDTYTNTVWQVAGTLIAQWSMNSNRLAQISVNVSANYLIPAYVAERVLVTSTSSNNVSLIDTNSGLRIGYVVVADTLATGFFSGGVYSDVSNSFYVGHDDTGYSRVFKISGVDASNTYFDAGAEVSQFGVTVNRLFL